MEPHPDQEDQPQARPDSRRRVILAIVIGAILLIVIALHILGAMTLHR